MRQPVAGPPALSLLVSARPSCSERVSTSKRWPPSFPFAAPSLSRPPYFIGILALPLASAGALLGALCLLECKLIDLPSLERAFALSLPTGPASPWFPFFCLALARFPLPVLAASCSPSSRIFSLRSPSFFSARFFSLLCPLHLFAGMLGSWRSRVAASFSRFSFF